MAVVEYEIRWPPPHRFAGHVEVFKTKREGLEALRDYEGGCRLFKVTRADITPATQDG